METFHILRNRQLLHDWFAKECSMTAVIIAIVHVSITAALRELGNGAVEVSEYHL
jgi:hypothetical protein